MRKASVSIPFVTWRDGKPRYFAGPAHRRLGFKGEDLRHNTGAWFTYEEAAAWSAARAAEVEARRAAPAAKVRARDTIRGAITVAGMFGKWFKTPRMVGADVVEGRKKRRALKASTVTGYKEGARIVEQFDAARVWTSPAAAITGKAWAGILDRIEVARGLVQARKVRATVSAAYSFALAAGLVPSHPLLGLKLDMPVPPPRIRYGSIAEMEQLIRAADLTFRREGKGGTGDEIGYRYGHRGDRRHTVMIPCTDVGDSIVLGLWSSQRQNDRLELSDGRVGPDGIVFLQSKKHGQPLLIPNAPQLAARIAALKARRASWKVNYPNLILDEGTRRPFERRWYAELFARVRDTAVKGIPGVLEPMPSLADFHDQDLRDTAVTWLALAGCDKWEIMSITGHSPKSIDEILSHYLGMHPELARSAIAKLVAWHEGREA